MSGPRFRLRHTFWLDMHKPDEAQLAEIVELLKRERTFAKTIRDGIRLICDLRAGRTDVLLELFPWVLNEQTHSANPVSTSQNALQQQLDRLEYLMLQQGSPAAIPADQAAPVTASGPKALHTPQIVAPRFEDDDDGPLLIQHDTTTNTAENFVRSMLNLIQ